MKTDDLIDLLAQGPDVRIDPAHARRDMALLLLGVAGSLVLVLVLLGPRRDLGAALAGAAFWIKFLFVAATAWAAAHAARRLSVPGKPFGNAALWLALPLAVLWLTAAAWMWQAAPDARAALFWGRTWRVCAPLIALVSLPAFASALTVMRRRAPTRPRLAGGMAGLAAGAAGALAYCVHCPEASPAFVGVWYVLGMLAPAAAGALAGPRLLRW